MGRGEGRVTARSAENSDRPPAGQRWKRNGSGAQRRPRLRDRESPKAEATS